MEKTITIHDHQVHGRAAQKTSEEAARRIMGSGFAGIRDTAECLRIKAPERHFPVSPAVPYPEALLRICRNTHILIPVFSVPVMDVAYGLGDESFPYHEATRDRPEAWVGGSPGWCLIARHGDERGWNKTWAEQKALLGDDEIVPSAHAVAYAIIIGILLFKLRLYEEEFIRCADNVSDYCTHATLGERGLYLGSSWKASRHSDFRIAPLKRPR